MNFSIYTLGCRVNQYESRAIAEALIQKGHTQLAFDEKCDVYIINSCAVTSESVRKSKQMSRRARRLSPGAKIIFTGCSAQLSSDSQLLKESECDYIIGNNNKYANTISAVFDEIEKTTVPSFEPSEYENYTIKSSSKVREYVKIEDGCEGKCAYCVIPKVRGPVRSKPFNTVLDEIQQLVAGGTKEIILTGIEISSYQYDFAKLLTEIDKTEGLERFSCGSLEPTLIDENFVNTIKDLKHLTPHFHLSLQSGSTTVLNRMRRKYNAKRALKSIEILRSAIPNVQFTCDVIVGFPGESESEFEETLDFLSQVGFLHTHIFTYSQRPGTKASEMEDQIPEEIKIKRSKILNRLDSQINSFILQNEVKTRKDVPVLAEQYKNGYNIGHSDNYIEYHIKSDYDLTGQIIKVNPIKTDNKIIFA